MTADQIPLFPGTAYLLVSLAERGYSGSLIVDLNAADEMVVESVTALIEAGVFTEEHTKTATHYVILTPTENALAMLNGDAIDHRALREAIGSGTRRVSPGDKALWLWLLRSGGELVGGFDADVRTNTPAMLHLLCCGLDYDRSTMPTDDTWTEGNTTFHEGDDHSGISAWAVCRCGHVGDHNSRPYRQEGIQVCAEVSGYVELLKAMIV